MFQQQQQLFFGSFLGKSSEILRKMVLNVRFELTTCRLQDGCSTPELIQQ